MQIIFYVHDLVLLPVEKSRTFFQNLRLPAPLDEATDLLLTDGPLDLVCYLAGHYRPMRAMDIEALDSSGASLQSHGVASNINLSANSTLTLGLIVGDLDLEGMGLAVGQDGRIDPLPLRR